MPACDRTRKEPGKAHAGSDDSERQGPAPRESERTQGASPRAELPEKNRRSPALRGAAADRRPPCGQRQESAARASRAKRPEPRRGVVPRLGDQSRDAVSFRGTAILAVTRCLSAAPRARVGGWGFVVVNNRRQKE